MNHLSNQLLRLKIKKQGFDNLLFSPLSLELLFAIILSGSQGKARKALLSIMGSSEGNWESDLRRLSEIIAGQTASTLLDDKGVLTQCDFANSFWYTPDQTISSGFEQKLRQQFMAQAYSFAKNPADTQHQINQWAATHTHQMITELPIKIEPHTVMVLLSALYLKTAWSHTFSDAIPDDFQLLDGSTATAQYMNLYCSGAQGSAYYQEQASFRAFTYMSKDKRIAFVIYLPHEATGLPQLLAELTPDALAKWNKAWQPITHFSLKIPKFEIEDEFKLSQFASSLGLEDLFIPSSDFSQMFSDLHESLYLSEMGQPSKIRVDKEGLEASAVSYAVLTRGGVSNHDEPIIFRATHPFYFQVQDHKLNKNLFEGIFTTPTHTS